MINHVRTLLMNRGREGTPLTSPGEEYIPDDFVPRKLNTTLSLAHVALFGTNPDRMYVNYIMRQLMILIHATPLAPEVTRDDSRITYLPFKQDLFADTFGSSLRQITDQNTTEYLVGEFTASNPSGLTSQIWDLSLGSGGELTITERRGARGTTTVTITEGIPIEIPKSTLSLYLYGASAGYRATITAIAKPDIDAVSLLQKLERSIGQNGISEVFPVNAGEPVETWRRTWNESHLSVLRFAALLLALARRIEQMPQGVS